VLLALLAAAALVVNLVSKTHHASFIRNETPERGKFRSLEAIEVRRRRVQELNPQSLHSGPTGARRLLDGVPEKKGEDLAIWERFGANCRT
jgi:hypothetical protein